MFWILIGVTNGTTWVTIAGHFSLFMTIQLLKSWKEMMLEKWDSMLLQMWRRKARGGIGTIRQWQTSLKSLSCQKREWFSYLANPYFKKLRFLLFLNFYNWLKKISKTLISTAAPLRSAKNGEITWNNFYAYHDSCMGHGTNFMTKIIKKRSFNLWQILNLFISQSDL